MVDFLLDLVNKWTRFVTLPSVVGLYVYRTQLILGRQLTDHLRQINCKKIYTFRTSLSVGLPSGQNNGWWSSYVAKCKVQCPLHAGRTNTMKTYTMEGKVIEKEKEEKVLGAMVHKAMNGSRQTISNKETDTVISVCKVTVRPRLE